MTSATDDQPGRRGVGTKIIATIGPASRDAGVLAELVAAGADGFRINCSHTASGEIEGIVKDVREAGGGFVIVDLAGPKLRSEAPFTGRSGERIVFGRGGIELTHPIGGGTAGGEVAFGDGDVSGEVVEVRDGAVVVELTKDVRCGARTGVHLSGVELDTQCIGENDEAHLDAAIRYGAEWVAFSYVADGADARRAAQRVGGRCGTIAKIERGSALLDLDEICGAVDAVMVARGDLGVDLEYAKVPAAQRKIFERCRQLGVPVVCATEMMGSMQHAARPTRAEVGDVEGVIRDGYDAMLLTAETAVGSHPVLVVAAAARIRELTEVKDDRTGTLAVHEDAVLARAAVDVADRSGVAAIVALTASGHTARIVAAQRPRTPVYAVSADDSVARRIGLYHGVTPVIAPRRGGIEASSDQVLQRLLERGMVRDGERVVLIGSRIGPEQDADVVMLRSIHAGR